MGHWLWGWLMKPSRKSCEHPLRDRIYHTDEERGLSEEFHTEECKACGAVRYVGHDPGEWAFPR